MNADETPRGHFPAGDPGRQLLTLPFAQRLGIRWDGWTDSGVRMRLPWSHRVRQPGTDVIDPGALLALVDQTCSSATFRGLSRPSLLATLDLRVEFAAAPASGADVICDADVEWLDDDWAFLRAKAWCRASGALVALVSSTYSLGSHPGGFPRERLTPELIDTWREAGAPGEADDLVQLLGLWVDGRRANLPFHESLVGAITLPALHGGAIAAAMSSAAAHVDQAADAGPSRLLVFSLQYLRAGRAQTLELEVDTIKPAGRARVHEISAHQGPNLIARASCVFARAA